MFVTRQTLKERGWTDSAIRKYLSEPDERRTFRVRGKGQLEEHAWLEERVLDAEARPELRAIMTFSRYRRACGMPAFYALVRCCPDPAERVEWAKSELLVREVMES